MAHWSSSFPTNAGWMRVQRAAALVAIVGLVGILQACSGASGGSMSNTPTSNGCGAASAIPVQNSPGNVIYDEVVGVNRDGRLEVFVIGGNNALWHAWQTRPSTPATRGQAITDQWSPWENLGLGASATPEADLRQLAVAQNGDGRLEVFAIAADGTLRHSYQTRAGAGPWSCWLNERSPQGGNVPLQHSEALPPGSVNPATFAYPKYVTAVAFTDGRLEVAAIGADGHVWTNWQTTPNAGPWCGWQDLGEGSIADARTPLPTVPFTSIASAVQSDGNVALFAIGADGILWQNVQTGPYAGCPYGYPMSAWARVAQGSSMSHLTSVAVVTDPEGHVTQLLATDTNGVPWQHPVPVSGGGWGTIGAAPSPLHQISGFAAPGGPVAAVALGDNGNVYYSARVDGGSNWVSLGRGDPTSEASHLVAAQNSDFSPQVFVFDNGQPTPGGPPCTGPCKGGKLWTIWQDDSGHWDTWRAFTQ